MIDERDIERRVKLIKKRNVFGIIMRVFLLAASLCMFLPVIKVQAEIFDGVSLNIGSFDLIRTDVDALHFWLTKSAEEPFMSGRSEIWIEACEKFINGGGSVLYIKDVRSLSMTLPAYHLVVFFVGIMCVFGIIEKLIKLACADGRVRKWAAKMNKQYPNGGYRDKKEAPRAVITIIYVIAAVLIGAALYIPLIRYPLLFKSAGCELNWFYLLLPVFCWVGFGIVLFISFLVFNREELNILRTNWRF